jgi:hypothetical protein
LYEEWKKITAPLFFVEYKRTAIYSMLGIVGLIIAIPLTFVNTYIAFALGILIFGGHLFKKK